MPITITVTHDDPENNNVLLVIPNGNKSLQVSILPNGAHTFKDVSQLAIIEGHDFMEQEDE